MTYIKNHISSDAAKHLASQLCKTSVNKFIIIKEMFKHLKNIYLDLNCLQTVKTDFCKLIMHKNDNFHEFLIKFLHLADEASISRNDYKYEINIKLTFDLQKAVVINFIFSSSFNEFFTYCFQVFHTFQNIVSIEFCLHRSQNSGRVNTSQRQQPAELTNTAKDAD